jgi:hypothetical protein
VEVTDGISGEEARLVDDSLALRAVPAAPPELGVGRRRGIVVVPGVGVPSISGDADGSEAGERLDMSRSSVRAESTWRNCPPPTRCSAEYAAYRVRLGLDAVVAIRF